MRRLASQLEAVRNSTEDSAQWRRALLRAQKELIAAQEVGDEKLHIMSQLQEHIDNKVRQMDIDLRNLGEYFKRMPSCLFLILLFLTLFFLILDYGKDQETNDSNKDNQTASSGVNAGSTRADNGTSGSGATGERVSKRARRNRPELGVTSQSDTANNSPDVPAAPELPPRREALARVSQYLILPNLFFSFMNKDRLI